MKSSRHAELIELVYRRRTPIAVAPCARPSGPACCLGSPDMYRGVAGRLVTEAGRVRRGVERAAFGPRLRRFSGAKDEAQPPFDRSLLRFLVCPLSKRPLRYEPETSELINDELGIAYPIVDGVPNMIPQEARLIQKDTDVSTTPAQG
ncbi:protein preY, mitochondrial-like [Gasterosteus aculeatus]